MKNRIDYCQACKRQRRHREFTAVVEGGMVTVVFGCTHCDTRKLPFKVPYWKYIGLSVAPSKSLATALNFSCDHCGPGEDVCRLHSVVRVARGKRIEAVVVLQCNGCLHEIHKVFEVGEKIPPEYLEAEQELRQAELKWADSFAR